VQVGRTRRSGTDSLQDQDPGRSAPAFVSCVSSSSPYDLESSPCNTNSRQQITATTTTRQRQWMDRSTGRHIYSISSPPIESSTHVHVPKSINLSPPLVPLPSRNLNNRIGCGTAQAGYLAYPWHLSSLACSSRQVQVKSKSKSNQIPDNNS